MGHESIETTRIYLRRTSTEQQKIVNEVHEVLIKKQGYRIIDEWVLKEEDHAYINGVLNDVEFYFQVAFDEEKAAIKTCIYVKRSSGRKSRIYQSHNGYTNIKKQSDVNQLHITNELLKMCLELSSRELK